MDEKTGLEIIEMCHTLLEEDWTTPVHPGCARFVAEVLYQVGIFDKNKRTITLTYDEINKNTIHGNTVKIDKPVPGCIVFFDKTYDAIAPAGVGPEDTYTHVGIVDKDVQLFWHCRSDDHIHQDSFWAMGWEVHEYRVPIVANTPTTSSTDEVQKLMGRGLINTYHNPKTNVTWKEFATVLNRLLDRIEAVKELKFKASFDGVLTIQNRGEK